MNKVIEVQQRKHSAKPWWQVCSDEEFKRRLAEQSREENETMIAEMNGTIAAISVVVQDKTMDPGKRSRARYALSYVVKRKGLLLTRVTQMNEASKGSMKRQRDEVVQLAREKVKDGDLAGALTLVLDWIDGFGRKP